MYAKSTSPSAKREVQKDRSAKRDDQIARSSLRAKRAARDENVPAKRADFFLIHLIEGIHARTRHRFWVREGGWPLDVENLTWELEILKSLLL